MQRRVMLPAGSEFPSKSIETIYDLFTACGVSNPARDDEMILFLPPPRYLAASHINGTTHFGPRIAWMSCRQD